MTMPQVRWSLALVSSLAACGGVAGQEVTPGEVFTMDATGARVHVESCVTDPYPKCIYRFEQADGTMSGPLESWNADLAEWRDSYAVSTGTFVQRPGEPLRRCAPTIFSGAESGDVPFSTKLAQTIVRNGFTREAVEGFNISVAFGSLELAEPIVNARIVDPVLGATRVTTGAPENAMLHPVRTAFEVCTETSMTGAEVIAYEWDLYCFIDPFNEWACGNY